jgi:hypothetical protein
MAQIDQKFSFNDKISVEMHAGNTVGGTNPSDPASAPNIPASVVISGNGGKQLNITTPFQKIVNPA